MALFQNTAFLLSTKPAADRLEDEKDQREAEQALVTVVAGRS